MPRAAGRRTWIKLYCYGRLHGSVVYQLTEAEQSVWDKLLCYAGILGREGQISDNDNRPFPHSFIAHELHTSEELLESTLSKCEQEGRIAEDGAGIHITNWVAYQSEYQRQKPYRQKVTEGVTTKGQGSYSGSYNKREQGEGEGEGEGEDRKEVSSKGDKSPSPFSEDIKVVEEALKTRRLDWKGNPRIAGERKAALWMLKQGYTVEQILQCHDALKADQFWQNKPLYLISVQSQIGEHFRKGQPQGRKGWKLPTEKEIEEGEARFMGGKHNVETDSTRGI